MAQVAQGHDAHRREAHKEDHLPGGFAPPVQISVADELTGYDSATGGQGREEGDEQNEYRVHQGHGRYRGFTQTGHHDGSDEACRKLQELLDDQGYNKFS